MSARSKPPDTSDLPLPPPPGYRLDSTVYTIPSGPSSSVSNADCGIIQAAQKDQPQPYPPQVAWDDMPPPWSPPASSQPPGHRQQYQLQVFVIGASGTAVPVVGVESFSVQIALSLFVLWLGNVPFGLTAFILAAVAGNKAVNDPKKAHSLGKASFGVSVAGIITAFTAIVVTIVVLVLSAHDGNGDGGESSTTCNKYYNPRGGGYYILCSGT